MSKRGAYLDSLRETFDCAFRVLTSECFKRMEGLGNEVPFFVLRYKPEWEPTVDEELSRLRRRLREERYRLADIDVFALAAGFWMSSPAFCRMLSMEATLLPPERFRRALSRVIDVESVLAPAIKEAVVEAGGEDSVDAVLLSGVHHLFPLVRTHLLLNCLQPLLGRVPLVVTFPGSYHQSPSTHSALVLFDQISQDNYYRAIDLVDSSLTLEPSAN
ncbi:BREX protein BrxB domain-containing protein [Schaalia odontolytica]|uniref:BREX protein BrxB domain-containing protein n=1 Tax=Schaalia odontolytica TaxID=1660 RepID=UPI0028D0674E|nr:BREX protein BrxB domain-containing protein [Schaalia odontolytica]